MLENLANVTTIASSVFGAIAGFIGGYLSVRMTLNNHQNEIDNLKKDDTRQQAELNTHQGEGHQKQFADLQNELIRTEGRLNTRIGEMEESLPNCKAHRAEVTAEMERLRSDVQIASMAKLNDIAEQNSRFREDLRQRFLTDTQEITREMLTPDGVAALVNKAVESLRKEEFKDIFHRLNELEKNK